MAQPVTAANDTDTTDASTSHSATLALGTISSGDMLFRSFCYGGSTPDAANSDGWDELDDAANAGTGLAIYVTQADGTETTSTCTTGSSVDSSSCFLRITGHLDPGTQAPDVAATAATGDGTNADPPSASVTGGPKLVLTIATYGGESGRWATAWPLADDNIRDRNGTGPTDMSCSLCTEESGSTSTEDPANFTTVTPQSWVAQTILVQEAGAGGGGTILPQMIHHHQGMQMC